ncbi:hypothetical protein T12_16045 [Trichinella patagoniensis]|uniref:Uncharacterized protein n=1 Tax=Trichinella patagoniensis TaxID=990121 RepID=A0A0V0ZUW1_9BILA|nr:hypothetical protein T12_16045 [Trichinella patagoniensis]
MHLQIFGKRRLIISNNDETTGKIISWIVFFASETPGFLYMRSQSQLFKLDANVTIVFCTNLLYAQLPPANYPWKNIRQEKT